MSLSTLARGVGDNTDNTCTVLVPHPGESLRTFYQMLGIIFFTHMGLLCSPGTICQNTWRFVGSDKVIPTFSGDGVISRSTCMDSRSGCRVCQGHETQSFTYVYDGGFRPADDPMLPADERRRDGSKGVSP